MKLQINKELEGLMRPLSKGESDLLESSIKRDGVIDPVRVWNGVVIDGHNRKRIADSLGVGYPTKEIDAGSLKQAMRWAVLNQVGKRNISIPEHSALWDRIAAMPDDLEGLSDISAGKASPKELGEASEKVTDTLSPTSRKGTPNGTNKAKEIAEVHGVSERTVHRQLAKSKANLSRSKTESKRWKPKRVCVELRQMDYATLEGMLKARKVSVAEMIQAMANEVIHNRALQALVGKALDKLDASMEASVKQGEAAMAGKEVRQGGSQ